MRVLLTGGAGFVGGHVLRQLRERGHDVVVLDALRADAHSADAPALPGLVHADLRKRIAVDTALANIDVVIHLAAKVGAGGDLATLPDYSEANLVGTAVLLAAMGQAGVGRLVLASSTAVYGAGVGRCEVHGVVAAGPRSQQRLADARFEAPCPRCERDLVPVPTSEDTPPDPVTPYAATKVAQEQLAGAWAHRTGGALAILRYGDLYGPGAVFGVAAAFRAVLGAGLRPELFEDGDQQRDFVHVSDAAAATVLTAEQHVTGRRMFHVASGEPHTVGELATELAVAMDGREAARSGRFRVEDVRHRVCLADRTREELGWQPQLGWHDGIAELAAAR